MHKFYCLVIAKFAFKFRYFLVFLVFVFMTKVAMAVDDRKIIYTHFDSVATVDYFKGIIELALAKMDNPNKYEINITVTKLSQGRILSELLRDNGVVDFYPSGSSKEREEKLIAIKVPLYKGTLGYRIPIIHKSNKSKFEKIKTLEDLQKFVACQGEHWPDSDILEYAKLPVVRNDDYKSMFNQTIRKYCDYFPRAIIEGYTELEAHGLQDTALMVFDQLLIMYPFPMYFFVSPHHKDFAADFEKGLTKTIYDGSFDKYFENNETTKDLYPLSKWENVTKIRIENPTLSADTPINDPKIWLNLK